jgi:hypothetical protein
MPPLRHQVPLGVSPHPSDERDQEAERSLSVQADPEPAGGGRDSLLARWTRSKSVRALVLPLLVLVGVLAWGAQRSRATQSTDLGVRADAYVRADRPNGNYGSSPRLRVDGSPRFIAYMRLPGTQGIPGGATLVAAVLHVHVNSGNHQGVIVRPVVDRWRETKVTWKTRPRLGPSIAESGPTSTGTWIDIDVTNAIEARSNSVALVSRDAHEQRYGAREGSQPPVLVLIYDIEPSPSPSPSTAPSPSGPVPYRYMYNSGSDQAVVAAAGWNLLDTGASKSEVDALPSGTKALVWVGDYDNSTCAWQVSDAALTSQVTDMAGDPKVAGYFFSDEPDPNACPNAPAQHKARSDLIHNLDPGKFTLVVLDSNSGQASLDQIPLWVGVADYAGLDPYPCYQGEACDYSWIDENIAAADAAGLTYWGVVQAFNDATWRWPTPDEENHMLAQWAASAEKGYMTFAWTWAGSNLSSKPNLLAVLENFNLTGAVSLSPGPIPSLSPSLSPSSSPSGDPMIAAAGDIACPAAWGGATSTDCRQSFTAQQIIAYNPTAVLTLGDNQYEDGALSEFLSAGAFDVTWGQFKAKTFPAPGNHEYHTAGAQGYFDYFGSRAPGPYYSFDIGAWHLISLNGDISAFSGSPQETWLRSDLAAHSNQCTLAYWHEPRWSSGSTHGSDSTYSQLWQDLYGAGADVVLNGHEHEYERFAPQNPTGQLDTTNGIREFVVGTGGAQLYSFGAPITNSEFRYNADFGILLITLHATSYDWQFVAQKTGAIIDSGTTPCH